MLCKAYGTGARHKLLSHRHGEKTDNTESGWSQMHISDKNVDEVQYTAHLDVVIQSSRLYCVEVISHWLYTLAKIEVQLV
jgi:hypothetical protein